jgi:rare lipoprotein A
MKSQIRVSAALCCALALLTAACSTSPAVRSPPAVPEQSPPPTPPANLQSIPDAVPRAEPRSNRGNPVYYEVFGKRYFLLPTATGYKERGVASWYGPDFHARPTSSGEPYDMYAMTAAHKTLPIPAYARVTNISNGRSVVVRINDRGPFVGNRIIDLSYTAAHKLDMTRAGTAFVEVEVLSPGHLAQVAQGVAAPAATALIPPGLYLQAGAFGVAANAQQVADKLRAAGLPNVTVLAPAAASLLHRVRIGPVTDVATFDMLAARAASLGIETRLVTE